MTKARSYEALIVLYQGSCIDFCSFYEAKYSFKASKALFSISKAFAFRTILAALSKMWTTAEKERGTVHCYAEKIMLITDFSTLDLFKLLE